MIADNAHEDRERAMVADDAREDRERAMFGCTTAAIDEVLAGKDPRHIALYVIGTLSNAAQLIRHSKDEEGEVEWSVADRHANAIRQFINIAKYALEKVS